MGAVYTVDSEDAVLERLPVPAGLIDQFASVLLSFNTDAVHVTAPPSVTCTAPQDTVTEGVFVLELLLLPHEVNRAGAIRNERRRNSRSQGSRAPANLLLDSGTNKSSTPRSRTVRRILGSRHPRELRSPNLQREQPMDE